MKRDARQRQRPPTCIDGRPYLDYLTSAISTVRFPHPYGVHTLRQTQPMKRDARQRQRPPTCIDGRPYLDYLTSAISTVRFPHPYGEANRPHHAETEAPSDQILD